MSRTRSSNRNKIKAPEGLTPAVQAKSRRRRQAQRKLASLEEGGAPRNDLLPALSVEYVLVDSLQPAKRRVRKPDRVQAARIDRSIRQFGICLPVLVDRDYRIVHGHEVCEGARRARLSTLPVIVIDHLDESERRALTIALNRLAETGVWDEEALVLEFEELVDSDVDVITTGFDLAEIDALLIESGDKDHAPETVPPLPEVAVSQIGDLWQLGDHRLLRADALDSMNYRQVVGDDVVRLVMTDEPYNVPVRGHISGQNRHREFAMAHGELSREEFADFNRRWMENAASVLVEGGLLATFIDWRSIELVLACGREQGLDLLNLIIWSKPNAGQGSLWRSGHELLPFFKKGTAAHVNNVELGRHGRWRSNVWTYAGATTLGSDAREGLAVHPTVKPRAMLEDALLDVTERGEMVLDPFVGSGSMILAAETMGRACRAIEIDGCYCDLTIARWQDLTGETAILSETGEPFAEVAERRLAEVDNGEDDGDGQRA